MSSQLFTKYKIREDELEWRCDGWLDPASKTLTIKQGETQVRDGVTYKRCDNGRGLDTLYRYRPGCDCMFDHCGGICSWQALVHIQTNGPYETFAYTG
jgi:hypothetical protein